MTLQAVQESKGSSLQACWEGGDLIDWCFVWFIIFLFFFNWKAHRPQTMVFVTAWNHQRVWRPFCSSSQRSWGPFTLHPGISLNGGEVQTAAVLQISQQIVFLKWMQWDYFRCGYNYFSGQILQWDHKRPLIAGHRQIFCMEGNQLSNLALQTVFNHVAVCSPARLLSLSGSAPGFWIE